MKSRRIRESWVGDGSRRMDGQMSRREEEWLTDLVLNVFVLGPSRT